MKRSPDDVQRLIAELRNDLSQIEQLSDTNGRAAERIAAGAEDYLDYAALGYTIHNIYAVMENACLRVAKFFENNLSDSSWHKDLLERMRLTIEGVRPALLDEDTYLLLDELRAFRHVFRTLYARPIDHDTIHLVQKKVPAATEQFIHAVERYITELRRLHDTITP
ncbi:MAG: antitoxin [Spirochaetaceae bacterium]|nr:MAG: antitoxin [Spirochaetaceae bacterium]